MPTLTTIHIERKLYRDDLWRVKIQTTGISGDCCADSIADRLLRMFKKRCIRWTVEDEFGTPEEGALDRRVASTLSQATNPPEAMLLFSSGDFSPLQEPPRREEADRVVIGIDAALRNNSAIYDFAKAHNESHPDHQIVITGVPDLREDPPKPRKKKK